MKAELLPITEADIPAVASFLHEELNSRVSPDVWAAAIVPPWTTPETPNHGFMLRSEGAVVGVYLAFYSERVVGGRLERFCNLAAWCVRPAFRSQSFRLLMKLMGQKGYTFTDLSPSGDVVPLNEKLGFKDLDATTRLMPNLLWPTLPGRTTITTDPRRIEHTLTGRNLGIYRDHKGAPAAQHLVVSQDGRSCYVVWRRVTRKNLPLFASILYASDPELLARTLRPLSRHLLLRHHIPFTLLEACVTPARPRWSRQLGTARRKMYKSSHLGPDQIDSLYSELVCVPW